jgi:hypothetical protein
LRLRPPRRWCARRNGLTLFLGIFNSNQGRQRLQIQADMCCSIERTHYTLIK